MKSLILKISLLFSILTILFLGLGLPVFAHVTVKPSQVGVAAFQTFTIGVPNEKDNPTVALRLVVPDGLKFVSPNVKSGWKIEVKKEGDGEDAKVTQIDWTGGSIPEGQRDEFVFSAQVPSKETTISWKAYQTYSDGAVVSWDQKTDPKMSDEDREAMEKKNQGPYSETKIVNDLKNTSQIVSSGKTGEDEKSKIPLLLSGAALLFSLIALVNVMKKK